MLYQAIKKVPGGKLLNVKIEADSRINAVHINGDFFLHPEDSLQDIEKNLVGLPADIVAPEVARRIHHSLATQKAAFIGVTPEYIAEAVVEALQKSAPSGPSAQPASPAAP